jgi:hypothetical protein
LPTDEPEIISKYQEILMNKFKLDEHLNNIKILKDDLYILSKIQNTENNNFNIVVLDDTYHKIKLVRDLEKEMKINKLQVDKKIDDVHFFNIPDKTYLLMKKVFRIVRAKPTNKADLFKMYISMIKNITCQEFIISTKGTTRKNKTTSYKLNDELIKFHVELNLYSNNYLTNYDADILKMLDIMKPKRAQKDNKYIDEYIEDDIFIDDENDDNRVIKQLNIHHLDDDINDE